MKKSWISVHIFYFGDQNSLIVDCVAPLVADLREQGLIQRYFFIKYWFEGPHVRLRFLPARDADDEKIRHLAELAITAFLRQHPALYRIDERKAAPFYKEMFLVEYGEKKWRETYGENGFMPVRPNNSFAYIDYEPEYGRYGGPEGIEVAEWHFEHSSDIVIGLLRETNISVKSMLLGRSTQLTLPFFYGIFEEDDKVLQALEGYISFWKLSVPREVQQSHFAQYAQKYQRMAPILQQRISKIRNYMLEEYPSGKLTEAETRWRQHMGELHLAIDKLYHEKKDTIHFDKQPDSFVFTLDDVRHRLLPSYVHMTNNRLGVRISEEVYVTYLLKRSLEDLLAHGMKETA